MLSIRQIARQHAVSDKSVRNRAHDEGWTRDLTAKVRTQVCTEIRKLDAGEEARTERDIVQAAARRSVEVVRQHRHTIGRGRDLVDRLINELEATTSHLGELESAIQAADDDERKKSAMLRAISLPSRASIIRDLSTSAKNWVVMERQAFGLDERDAEADGFDLFLKRVAERGRSLKEIALSRIVTMEVDDE